MKNFVSLLLVVGLVVAGWMNREKLGGLWGKKEVVEAEPAPEAPPVPETATAAPTPNPAREAQAEATRIYPGLNLPNSPLNKKFVALYAEAKLNNPALLARADWPLQLADRAMVELGGTPMARGTPAPVHTGLPGGALDQKPGAGSRAPGGGRPPKK